MKKIKYICLSVVVGLKIVTDKVELSMKKLIGVVGLSDMTATYMYSMWSEVAYMSYGRS